MNVWIPWDADEDEAAELSVVRENIPETMRPALLRWLHLRLLYSNGRTSPDVVNSLQTALRVDLELGDGHVPVGLAVDAIEARGNKFLLRVVDWFLGSFEPRRGMSGHDPAIADLSWHLDTAMSGIEVHGDWNGYRLRKRLPEGIEEAAQVAVTESPGVAGVHLAKAIREAQSMDPDTSLVMTEAIRAVEAAAGPVVLPNASRHRLSIIVQALKDKSAWSLVLERRDDGYPDHRAVLIGMLETLVFAQRDRHAGGPPSREQALAHALLAANLVGWFAAGAVQMNEG